MTEQIKSLADAIKKTDMSDGVHQAVLNVGYDYWQANPKLSYMGMLVWMEEQFGTLARFAVQTGKYNQQVGNGGHMQYFDNGYASSGGGFGDNHDPDLPLHQDMLDMFKELKLHTTKEGKPVFDIMSRFYIAIDEERVVEEACDECGGNGEIEVEMEVDDEDYGSDRAEYETCPACDGEGVVECDNPNYGYVLNRDELDKLDDEYYAVEEVWMNFLERYLTTELTKVQTEV